MKTTRQLSFYALSLIAAAVMAGCSTPVPLAEPAPVVTAPVVKAEAPAPTPTPMPERKVATVDLSAQYTQEVSSHRAVYFDFDSFIVKDEYRGLVEAHAKRLNYTKTLAIRLEGNTDERGGSEYNLALGQKRAEAVAKSLTLLGVSPSQVEPTSFGKERPLDAGHNEAAWAKNRRVDLKDK